MLGLPTEADIAAALGMDVDTDLVLNRAIVCGRQLGADLGIACWPSGRTHGRARELCSPSPENTGRRSLRYAALGLLAAGAPDTTVDLIQRDLATASHMTAEIGALTAMPRLTRLKQIRNWKNFIHVTSARQPAGRQMVFPPFASHRSGCGGADRETHGPSRLPPQHAKPSLCADRRVHVNESFRLPCRRWRGLPGRRRYDPETGQDQPPGCSAPGHRFPQLAIMDEVRRRAATAQLERIVATPGLSHDCFEIVSKTLKG